MTTNQRDLRDLTEDELGDLYRDAGETGDLELRGRIDFLRLERTNAGMLEYVSRRAASLASPVWFQVRKTQWQPGWADHYKTHPYEIRYRTVADVDRTGRRKDSRAGSAGHYLTRDEAIAAGQAAGWIQVADWAEAREQARPRLEADEAESDRRRAAQAGLVEVTIGRQRNADGGIAREAETRLVTAAYAAELLAQLGPADNYGRARVAVEAERLGR